jgi:hypothetical protein
MLMTSISSEKAVPAETLFPTWRGRLPYAERLRAVSSAHAQAHPGLAEAVAQLPFEQFEAADAVSAPVRKYNEPAPAARAMLDKVPAELRSAWLCALTMWHIDRFDARFAASGLDHEFALHYADSFHRIIDQIGTDPSFADLSKDSFLKDLWLTRVVMIPAFAQVWWPHSGLSASAVLRSGAGAAAYVFLRCGGRAPFLEGHTHDPVAKAYWNEAGWGEALRLAALALPALPRACGVFGTAWFYDPALKEVTPRLSFAQDLQVGKGAHRIRIGSNEDSIRNATATSKDRRSRYEAGSYIPTDYAVIWSRKDLVAAYGA